MLTMCMRVTSTSMSPSNRSVGRSGMCTGSTWMRAIGIERPGTRSVSTVSPPLKR